MSAGNLQRVRHRYGRLCINPNSLSSAFPHGGTAIGEYREMRFDPQEEFAILTAEEYRATIAVIAAGRRPMLRAVLRDWDTDALSYIWPNTTAGGTSGDRTIDINAFETGKVRDGAELSGVVLCFSPYDLENSRMLLMYKAVPRVDEAASVQMNLPDESDLAIVFEAIPDSSGRFVRDGLREDLAL